MMRRTVFLLVTLLILSVGYSVHADDDEAWGIVQRCFGDATEPPADWTFDGTLLMTSAGQLHAFRQEWETPRILVFGEGLPVNGALSPDMRWYAVTEYEREDFEFSTAFHEKAIRVYSLIDDEQYVVPWENTFSIDRRQIGHRLYWLDNQHLLYSRGDTRRDQVWFQINPFTQEIELWEANLNPSEFTYDLAPDATKALYTNWGLDYWVLDGGEDEIQLPLWGGGVWRPDSQVFAAYTEDVHEPQPDQLTLIDLNGSIINTLFDVPIGIIPDTLFTKWSYNAGRLLFAANHLYIADIEMRQVIDTCIFLQGIRSAVWSANGNQFILTTYYPNDEIQIFDLETWQRYVVSYHSGDVIGWRTDD